MSHKANWVRKEIQGDFIPVVVDWIVSIATQAVVSNRKRYEPWRVVLLLQQNWVLEARCGGTSLLPVSTCRLGAGKRLG